jgi:hypothetical protein
MGRIAQKLIDIPARLSRARLISAIPIVVAMILHDEGVKLTGLREEWPSH